MEEKNDKSEQSKKNPEENNSRRKFLKVAAVAAGGTALVATINGVARVPFLNNDESATTEPLVAAAPMKPKKLTKYVDALVIPPVLSATTVNGIDNYNLEITQGTTHQFHLNLPPTTTQSYFAAPPLAGFHYLGPTIVAQQGTPVRINVINKLPLGPHQLSGAMDYTLMGNTNDLAPGNPKWLHEHRTCVHLHGGKVSVESDGGPRDWFSPAGSSQVNPYPEAIGFPTDGSHTYDYPNDQPAAMIWYHDHAWGITRLNPFLGQAGGYIVRDAGENALISTGAIPNGVYEVPIILQDRLLDLATGAMLYPPTPTPGTHPVWMPEYFGDTPIVNGKAYPFFNVEPRRYRFRFLSGTQARFFNIWFNGAAGPIPMWVIGSEQGFLPAPVVVTRLLIAPGERFDTIFDFTGLPNGTILTLKNNAKAPYPGGRGGDIPDVMQFRVVTPLIGTDTTLPPASLTLPTIDPPLTLPAKPWREIVLSEIMDIVNGQPLEALLDGVPFTFSCPPNPPLFTEPDGATNVWQFINTTGDAHPMHIHLVKFKIVDRQRFDSKAFLVAWDAWNLAGRPTTGLILRPSVDAYLIGAPMPPAPEETGWKDTAKAYPGEVLRIIAKFDLPPTAPAGITHRYVCHCHILEHEENDMMFYFGVNKPLLPPP